jgi:phosphatidylserine synthase
MKTTYRMMGIADYITLANGLLGAASIMFIILAVETLQNPFFDEGVKSNYIWLAMGCILLSVVGDIIDGPVARKYSKRKILGGTLDVMSDCISFCVAPALLMFVMFGRWGEASPLWSISLGIACCWVIVTGMLRLARFQHEEGSDKNYFHGLASPGNAMILITMAALIWLQPSSGFGPEVSTNCIFCFETTSSTHEKPYFDFLILPVMFISGALMISDRKLSKTKKGIPMRLSGLQLLTILIATILSIIHSSEVGVELVDTRPQFILYAISAILLIIYIAAGPKIAAMDNNDSTESE